MQQQWHDRGFDSLWKKLGLEKTGVKVHHLEVGQPDFDAPESAVTSAADAIANPAFQKYIPNNGLDVARDSVAKMFTNRGCATGRENVIVTQGCMFAIATALGTIVDVGDEVLVPDPGWPNYDMSTKTFKAVPVSYRLDDEHDFEPDFAHLESVVTERTKCIIVCNPSNPTGAVFSRDVLQKLVDFARKHGLYVISDEIYAAIYFGDDGLRAPSMLDVEHDPDSMIVLGGVSKEFSMTGFRVGWLRASENFVYYGTQIQEAFVSCGVPASQLGAVAALEEGSSITAMMVETYHQRRDIVVEILKAYGLYTYTPQGAFYVLVGTRGGLGGTETSTDFALRLLKEKHVAVAPGDTFGPRAKQFVRLSLATDTDSVREGTTLLCEFILESEKRDY